MTAPALVPSLAHGLSFDDLYDREGLARLDAAFVAWLKETSIDGHARLMAARPQAVLGLSEPACQC